MATLEEIEALPREVLVATDVSGFLDTSPNTLRWQAQNEPDKLGFPVIVIKSRVIIPKAAFVFFCRYGRPVPEQLSALTEEAKKYKEKLNEHN